MVTPSDDDIRMLLETYRHCRKWAHAGEVGTNAVTLIAALDELLELRSERLAFNQAIAQLEKLHDATRRATQSAQMGAQVLDGTDGSVKDQACPKRDTKDGKGGA
jgi:outer membrane murein-binding lipoprotein Lpp